MSLTQLVDFFQWMTLINVGLLMFSALMVSSFKSLIFRFHGQMFGLAPEQISLVLYGFLGTYKLLIFVFNLVPYLAMLIISN
ncbi:hypothetical protein HR45_08560 [Shewanella mangrovi]|uniref:DUF6868 domain-containing protein n=1 Tax=Shewanella mangrovi TaxID=1515746 RepID=A0A094JZT1_9GAMM|nr:hypothetical protein [Shewanella mangrovi]KFZ37886.1 hypothetical protein HR45_08560 [Shewanella mangrovi]